MPRSLTNLPAETLFLETVAGARNPHQCLGLLVTDRNHQTTADQELFEQWLGRVRRSGSHDDPIVGSVLRPTDGAIAHMERDILIIQLIEQAARFVRQGADFFYGEHVESEFREERRLITRACADLQDLFVARKPQSFAHPRRHIGLR